MATFNDSLLELKEELRDSNLSSKSVNLIHKLMDKDEIEELRIENGNLEGNINNLHIEIDSLERKIIELKIELKKDN